MLAVDIGLWIYIVFLLALLGPFSDRIHLKGPAKILLIVGVAVAIVCAFLHFMVAYAGKTWSSGAKEVLGWFLTVLQTGSLGTTAVAIVWTHIRG